ncbi:MAG: type IV toxin-antitoxin system AbiEi family antitoxin, partial [Streptosporangiaceae bacterium]
SAAAWHLGYLDRALSGRVPLWLPAGLRLPDGLRPVVSVARIDWPPPAWDQLGPTPGLLARRGLDLVSWSTGLPAFGPEALVVQLAARPASFEPWSDLVAHLDTLVADVDDGRLVSLLDGQSASTWQRAAYLIHAGGHPQRGLDVLDRRPPRGMPIARFTRSQARADGGLWVPEYRLMDQLISPTQQLIGKA